MFSAVIYEKSIYFSVFNLALQFVSVFESTFDPQNNLIFEIIKKKNSILKCALCASHFLGGKMFKSSTFNEKFASVTIEKLGSNLELELDLEMTIEICSNLKFSFGRSRTRSRKCLLD